MWTPAVVLRCERPCKTRASSRWSSRMPTTVSLIVVCLANLASYSSTSISTGEFRRRLFSRARWNNPVSTISATEPTVTPGVAARYASRSEPNSMLMTPDPSSNSSKSEIVISTAVAPSPSISSTAALTTRATSWSSAASPNRFVRMPTRAPSNALVLSASEKLSMVRPRVSGSHRPPRPGRRSRPGRWPDPRHCAPAARRCPGCGRAE